MATPTHTVFSYFLSRTVVDFNVLASGRVETRKFRSTNKKYSFSLFNL